MVYRLKAKIRSVVCILLVAVILAGSLPGCGVIKGDTVMEYEGYKITEAAQQVQEKVKSGVENMTGLSVMSVNVNVSTIINKPKTEKEDE